MQPILTPFAVVGSHVTNGTLSSAVTLTVNKAANAIIIQAFTQSVRITFDGTTPTASVGFLLTAADGPVMIAMPPNRTLKVIESTASASIQYQYVRTLGRSEVY